MQIELSRRIDELEKENYFLKVELEGTKVIIEATEKTSLFFAHKLDRAEEEIRRLQSEIQKLSLELNKFICGITESKISIGDTIRISPVAVDQIQY